MRRVLAVATSLMVAGSAMAATAPPVVAKTTTYKACVKKKTGEMRILLGKKKNQKCKKGWKKTTWTKAGPKGKVGLPGSPGSPGGQGATGARATMGMVVDGNGAAVGEALETLNMGLAHFSVRIDGGIYSYYANGWLLPNGEVFYSDASCTSAPFTLSDSELERSILLSSVGYRAVYRATNPSLGPASAFGLVGTSQSVTNAQYYSLNGAGVCTAQGALFTGYLLPLTSVAAPPDRPGPLKIQ